MRYGSYTRSVQVTDAQFYVIHAFDVSRRVNHAQIQLEIEKYMQRYWSILGRVRNVANHKLL